MAKLQDSGERREFETGAARDISEGKGRCDLLPLDVVGQLLMAPPLFFMEKFKESKDVAYLQDAITTFCNVISMDIPTAMLEVSIHFEDGAKKYSENNWKKGIPLHAYLDSAARHYLKYARGDTDEPHDRAFIWNLLCAYWTYAHKPEQDDVEIDSRPFETINEIRTRFGLASFEELDKLVDHD